MKSLPIPPDIAAMVDVIDRELVPAVDDLDGDRADSWLRGLEQLTAQTKRLTDAVKAKLRELAEKNPLKAGTRVYVLSDKLQKRADNDGVARQVVELAVLPDPETGEIPDARKAARRATQLMLHIYTTPSTVPAQQRLDDAGIVGRIVSNKVTGSELEVIQTRAEED